MGYVMLYILLPRAGFWQRQVTILDNQRNIRLRVDIPSPSARVELAQIVPPGQVAKWRGHDRASKEGWPSGWPTEGTFLFRRIQTGVCAGARPPCYLLGFFWRSADKEIFHANIQTFEEYAVLISAYSNPMILEAAYFQYKPATSIAT